MAFTTSSPWYANGTITTDGTTKVVGSATNWTDVGSIAVGDMLTLDGSSFYQIQKVGDGTTHGDGTAGTPAGTTAGNNTILIVDRPIPAGSSQPYTILQNSLVNPVNSDIAYKVAAMVQSWQGREDELTAWLGGTSGTFPMTDAIGNTVQVKCPAQMQADVDATVASITAGGIDNVLKVGASTSRRVSTGGYDIPSLSSTLPIGTIVDYDTFDNTDDAAWIDKCGHCSWETEARHSGRQFIDAVYANDAAVLAAHPDIVSGDLYYNGTNFIEYGTSTTWTRGSSRKFPMRGFVTAEASRVIIWDTTSGSEKMWMVFKQASYGYVANLTSSVAISKHILCLGDNGTGNGLTVIDFTKDQADNFTSGASGHVLWKGNIANRNTAYTGYGATIGASIVNNTVNSVAITYLPDAPYDEFGMPKATIAVGTAGGVSVIKDDGSVVNTAVWGYDVNYVTFYDNTHVWVAIRKVEAANTAYSSVALLDIPLVSNGFGTAIFEYMTSATAGNNYSPWQRMTLAGATAIVGRLFGTKQGIIQVFPNPTTPANGMVAYMTSTYSTGGMVGDIRRCFLANSLTADRSVKGGTLTVNGTITETVNAGGRNVYSGFSATNYLSEASHADWNALGTGDFSIIMSGVKWGTAGVARGLLSWGNGTSVGSIYCHISAANRLFFAIADGTTLWNNYIGTGTSVTYTDTNEHTLEFKRVSGTVSIVVDGIDQGAIIQAGVLSGTISNTTAPLVIGKRQDLAEPWAGGQCACVRISATAPTAEQSMEIAKLENALNGGTACLLKADAVTDLRYDSKTDLYAVETANDVDLIHGLAVIESKAKGTALTTPYTGIVTGSKVMTQPAVDVNSELAAYRSTTSKRTVLLDFNVVVNGKFSTTSGWTLGAGWSIANGVLTAASVATGTSAVQNFSGKATSYVTSFTVTAYTSGTIALRMFGVNGLNRTSAGTYTQTLSTTAGGQYAQFYAWNTGSYSIDNLFVRESTDKLPMGFKPKKVWAGGMLQEEGTDYDVTFDGFLYGISFFIEPATNIQVEGEVA